MTKCRRRRLRTEAALWRGDSSTHLQTTAEQLARNVRLKLNPISTSHPLQCRLLHANNVVICCFFFLVCGFLVSCHFLSPRICLTSVPLAPPCSQCASTCTSSVWFLLRPVVSALFHTSLTTRSHEKVNLLLFLFFLTETLWKTYMQSFTRTLQYLCETC